MSPTRNLTFLLDVDNVLADFNSAAVRAAKLKIDPNTIDTFYFYAGHISREEFDSAINSDPQFWINLDLLPWAKKLYLLLSGHGQVIFCTSPGRYRCADQKIDWLIRHGFLLSRDTTEVVITANKHLLAKNQGYVLVDDSKEQLQAFADAGGHVIPFPQLWTVDEVVQDKLLFVERRVNSLLSRYRNNIFLDEQQDLKSTEESVSDVDVNPKDRVGREKPGLASVPCASLFEVGSAMAFGGRKYGRHNWRVGEKIRASIYYDAIMRHIMRWWEGEDVATDSEIHHLSHAAAGAMILRDAELLGNMLDDRPVRGVDPVANAAYVTAKMLKDVPIPKRSCTQKDLET